MKRQIPTPSGDTCPDCHLPLTGKQTPCGWLNGEPVWCAYCESDQRGRVKNPKPPPREATPDPITVDWLRDLLERRHITQREAGRLLHVDERTARKWATGEREMPWAAGELLRRLLEER